MSLGGSASSRKFPHQKPGLAAVVTTAWSPRSSTVASASRRSMRSVRKPSERTSMGCTLAGGAGLACLLYGDQGITELLDPVALVLADELDAPGQRLAATSGDPGINQGVEHLALVVAQTGHDRDGEAGEH